MSKANQRTKLFRGASFSEAQVNTLISPSTVSLGRFPAGDRSSCVLLSSCHLPCLMQLVSNHLERCPQNSLQLEASFGGSYKGTNHCVVSLWGGCSKWSQATQGVDLRQEASKSPPRPERDLGPLSNITPPAPHPTQEKGPTPREKVLRRSLTKAYLQGSSDGPESGLSRKVLIHHAHTRAPPSNRR